MTARPPMTEDARVAASWERCPVATNQCTENECRNGCAIVVPDPTTARPPKTEGPPIVAQGAGLSIGDKMRKLKGYTFNGEVRSVFKNKAGEVRLVCELEGENGGGMLHIFSPSQVEARQ
jgi:hypothetical protein